MEELDAIRRRIKDCKSYNFGMRNADKLAHEDAAKLLAALEAVAGTLALLTTRATNDTDRIAYHFADAKAAEAVKRILTA